LSNWALWESARSLARPRSKCPRLRGQLGHEGGGGALEALVLERRRDDLEQRGERLARPAGAARRAQLEPGTAPAELAQRPLELGFRSRLHVEHDDGLDLVPDHDGLRDDGARSAAAGCIALRIELERQRALLLEHPLGGRTHVCTGPPVGRPARRRGVGAGAPAAREE
jgi:hypothetical protein